MIYFFPSDDNAKHYFVLALEESPYQVARRLQNPEPSEDGDIKGYVPGVRENGGMILKRLSSY